MTWSGRSVLVTGGSGFIGSHLIEALSAKGANVISIDVRPPKFLSNDERIKHIVFDIRNGLPQIEHKIDTVFHLAALAVPSLCDRDPHNAFITNVNGTYNIVKFAQQQNVSHFIFTSTALMYGRNPKYLPIDEEHPLEPLDNVYSLTKSLGEELCNMLRHEKMSTVILRLFNTFGPRQDQDYLIPTIIAQAIEKGLIELWNEKPTRDFNFVGNTVNALIASGDSNISGIFNVGSGEEVNTGEIAKYIASKFGADIKFLNKDVIGSLRLRCDNTKMLKTFGWKPSVSFKEGIQRTLEWYEKTYNASHFK